MNLSKVAVIANSILGMILIIVGSVPALIFLFGTVALLAEGDGAGAIAGFLFFAIFTWITIKGIQIRRRVKRFRRYVSLISEQNMSSIDHIAATTNQSADFVRKDLQTMINKRFFKNAFINKTTNDIIIGGQAASMTSTNPVHTIPPISSQNVAQTTTEVVNCSGCGASTTKLKGTEYSCEYCGSLIK